MLIRLIFVIGIYSSLIASFWACIKGRIKLSVWAFGITVVLGIVAKEIGVTMYM